MIEQVANAENVTSPHLANRIRQLEEQIKLINMRLQLQFTVPRFEFIIEVDDKPVWSGLDLPVQFSKICRQYPDKEFTISWRSSPVVWV